MVLMDAGALLITLVNPSGFTTIEGELMLLGLIIGNIPLIAKNYDEFDQYHLVYNHNLFDKKNIRNYLSKAYSTYYLRINWLFKYFRSFITN